MKVCVVGSGGREHALACALNKTVEVVVAPGNPGIPWSISKSPEQISADLFVIGPEVPLVDGLADRLRSKGRLVFGPGADGARLEGSKVWMKNVLIEAGVPTARHRVFNNEYDAQNFLKTLDGPFVIKTDGLAAGKGVLVTSDRSEANDTVRSYLSGKAFGDAGRRLIIEEGLVGAELSVQAICDGKTAFPLVPAQDFKRLSNGDMGPNTGGMGAYSPVPVATQHLVDELMETTFLPTLFVLRAKNIDFRGVLYCGLMLTAEGPKVLEYNVRFGDPETQVVLPRITNDLTGLLTEAASGTLKTNPTFDKNAVVAVVCATEGYPDKPKIGDPIYGLDSAVSCEGINVYCAGVGEKNGQLVTAGGRVLTVTGKGETIDVARERVYNAIRHISWSGIQHREDIAAYPTQTDDWTRL